MVLHVLVLLCWRQAKQRSKAYSRMLGCLSRRMMATSSRNSCSAAQYQGFWRFEYLRRGLGAQDLASQPPWSSSALHGDRCFCRHSASLARPLHGYEVSRAAMRNRVRLLSLCLPNVLQVGMARHLLPSSQAALPHVKIEPGLNKPHWACSELLCRDGTSHRNLQSSTP